jgi:SpoVK/Ycf46/Vps4 family AAA+-type ATPase
VVNLDEIIGSGFAEVKGFMGQVESASKWHDLFVATSPSRTADKSNVLLIGPQGCGKSEILRAVGGDRKSIGVFAQGSDFLTCWKGEAEKNPKRLFEEALRLQRESHKHVHILIDEIDTILNKDSGRESFGGTNLVTEFQILMDGVVHYPHLSVWGATNNPERISMPMLRRFSKVLIVGELTVEDRTKLLKHFIGFMPTEGFKDADWMEAAEMLNGAVGDTIRKMCDHVWREKMSGFVENNQVEANRLVEWLNGNGIKFSIQDFDSKKKAALHDRLRPFVQVRPKDMMKSIEIHLENVAVHSEIRTAVETYDNARRFLASIKKTSVQPAV